MLNSDIVVLLDGINTASHFMFKDLKKDIIFVDELTNKNFLVRFFKKFRIYPKKFITHKLDLSIINDKVLLLTNESLTYISKSYLFELKKRAKYLVLFFIDGYHNNYPSIKNAKKLKNYFDLVYTYSKIDAEKYSFLINYCYYHKINIENNTSESDLFLICNPKKRFNLIKDICGEAVTKDVQIDFNISGSKRINYVKNIEFIPYQKTLELLNKSNCILDIINPGDTGMSLRYFEAICYNKKLLTNNKSIFKMPYYNEKYMKYFDSVSDIDWDWVKKKEHIDYKYQNDFEPIKFIESIVKQVKKIEENFKSNS